MPKPVTAKSVVNQVPASVRGVIGGVVALSLFDLFTGTSRGVAAFSWVSSAPASWLASWLDPTKPLITDQRTGTTGSGGTTKKAPNCSGLVGTGLAVCEAAGAGYTVPAPTTTLPTPSSPLYV